jgi:hypothetical protein
MVHTLFTLVPQSPLATFRTTVGQLQGDFPNKKVTLVGQWIHRRSTFNARPSKDPHPIQKPSIERKKEKRQNTVRASS